jgi:nucleotide-binding universal stress UspA family protein
MAQGYAPELGGQKQPARALVERIAAELRRAGFTTQSEVLIGDVTKTILDRAAEWRADLITVGSHGQRSIRDFLLGSVAESVLVEPDAPLLSFVRRQVTEVRLGAGLKDS